MARKRWSGIGLTSAVALLAVIAAALGPFAIPSHPGAPARSGRQAWAPGDPTRRFPPASGSTPMPRAARGAAPSRTTASPCSASPARTGSRSPASPTAPVLATNLFRRARRAGGRRITIPPGSTSGEDLSIVLDQNPAQLALVCKRKEPGDQPIQSRREEDEVAARHRT
jgi:hypothetical protein